MAFRVKGVASLVRRPRGRGVYSRTAANWFVGKCSDVDSDTKCYTVAAANVTLKGTRPTDVREKEVKPFRKIPGPKGLPYVGTLLRYKLGPYSRETYHHALLDNYYKYGKIFKETIAGKTRVHLFDPDYISLVYQQEDKTPQVRPLLETSKIYRKTKNMSLGLGNTNGEEWYRLRSAVQQMMMKPQAVSMYLSQVNEVVDDFLERMKRLRDENTGRVAHFENELRKWNLESSTMTCFEIRLGCLEAGPGSFQQKMIDASVEIFDLSSKLTFSLPWFKIFLTPTMKRLFAAEDFFFGNGQKLLDQAVDKIKSMMKSGQLHEGQFRFITYLMGKDALSYKDLSVLVLSLFSDGLNTTVPVLIGQLYCLATNPDKQETLYKSIREVAPDKNATITNDMISRSKYLRACIKEGFRFFPVGTEVSRIPKKDMVIGGYHIPAGTEVELNNNLLLRLPEYFDSPDSYLPERWLRGEATKAIHPYLLLPFGFGPRTCAGRRFAEQEMQVMLIRLLQNYRIEWPSQDAMRQKYRILLTPDISASFKFIPRD